MEELVKIIEDRCAGYEEILTDIGRTRDEWLKGYVAGLREARQIVLTLMNKKN